MVNEAELEYVGMVLWDSHIFIEVDWGISCESNKIKGFKFKLALIQVCT